uniref:Uncharacterized protein n=1 Tax=Arundo donax TaxID=35708 RepID=A0A0A9ADZ2_ARUDO
MVARVILLL